MVQAQQDRPSMPKTEITLSPFLYFYTYSERPAGEPSTAARAWAVTLPLPSYGIPKQKLASVFPGFDKNTETV